MPPRSRIRCMRMAACCPTRRRPFLYLIVTAGVGMQMRIDPSSLCKNEQREDQDSVCTCTEHGLTARRIAWLSNPLQQRVLAPDEHHDIGKKRSLECRSMRRRISDPPLCCVPSSYSHPQCEIQQISIYIVKLNYFLGRTCQTSS